MVGALRKATSNTRKYLLTDTVLHTIRQQGTETKGWTEENKSNRNRANKWRTTFRKVLQGYYEQNKKVSKRTNIKTMSYVGSACSMDRKYKCFRNEMKCEHNRNGLRDEKGYRNPEG